MPTHPASHRPHPRRRLGACSILSFRLHCFPLLGGPVEGWRPPPGILSSSLLRPKPAVAQAPAWPRFLSPCRRPIHRLSFRLFSPLPLPTHHPAPGRPFPSSSSHRPRSDLSAHIPSPYPIRISSRRFRRSASPHGTSALPRQLGPPPKTSPPWCV